MKTFQTLLALCLIFAGNGVTAFVPSTVRGFGPARQAPALNMDASTFSETANSIVSAVTSSGLIVAETEPWVQPLSFVLGPSLNFLSFAMVREKDIEIDDEIKWKGVIDVFLTAFSCLY
jgi:YggT family protein